MNDASSIMIRDAGSEDQNATPAAFVVDDRALALMFYAPLPVFLVSEDRRIVWQNDIAHRHRSLDGLELSGGGVFASENQMFEEKLAEVFARCDESWVVGTMNLIGLQLRLVRTKKVADNDPDPSVLIFVSETASLTVESSASLDAAALSRFELTNVETKLVLSISTGKSLREASVEHGMKYNTARKYLQNIFAKVGVRRQSELIAKIKAHQ